MLRTVLGVAAGIVVWLVTAALVGFAVGKAWPEFAVASRAPLTLTTAMLAARLSISGIGSIWGGYAAALIGKDRLAAPLIAGLLLLCGWGYYHVTVIWHLFPLWYHLTFFVSLPLLSVLGGRLARR